MSASGLVTLLAAAQLALLLYNPVPLLPRDGQAEQGDRLIEIIRSVRGEVYLPFHSHYAEMAGKRSFAHIAALRQITKYMGRGNADGLEMTEQLRSALRDRQIWSDHHRQQL